MQHKVLFISSWYPTNENKTHGIFVRRYAEAIALKNNVAVIHVSGSETFEDKLKIESRTEKGVYEVYVYFKKKNANAFTKFSNYKKHYLEGLEYLLKHWGKPDILQVNVFFPAAIAGMMIAKKLNIPYIVSEHWTGYDPADGSYKGIIKKYFSEKAAKTAKRIVVVSKDLKQKMLKHGLKGEYETIPNVVDTGVFRYKAKPSSPSFRFIHISSLEPAQKNVEGLIRVFKELKTANPLAELIIIGDSVYKDELERQSGSLLNNSVFFRGQKFGTELVAEIQAADCLVMFSNYENLPVVMLEAMCCGLPVISTDVGGIKEWVGNGEGILVTPGDEKELLNAVKKIIIEKEKYNHETISRHACKNFNYGHIASLFTNVYDEVLKAKN
ncbi:MAG: glycosyltransferase family 4 protein [Bacteroidetes bacterium]|nr:glycosyltransferase family 4 protein [Bacteroidota bacterium]